MHRLPEKAPIFLLTLSGLVAPAQTGDTLSRLTNGKPDMNGVWQLPYLPYTAASSRDGSQMGPGTLPLTPEDAEKFNSCEENNKEFTEGHIK